MNKTQARAFLKEVGSYESLQEAAADMGINRTTLWRRIRKINDTILNTSGHKPTGPAASRASSPSKSTSATKRPAAIRPPAVKAPTLGDSLVQGDTDKVRIKHLENELRRIRAQNTALANNVLDDTKVREQIMEIAHAKPKTPAWLKLPKGKAGDTTLGVPILFGSDWHWGEVVNPDEIGGVNKYNMTIAHERANRLIEGAINLLTNHMVNPSYPGIVFALGGDMVSGNIHEELVETNEMPIMPVVLDLIDYLAMAIRRLKSVFGRVFLPCVAGNHGRGHKKPRAKQSNFSSYDWLIFQALDREFADDQDVVFYIPDGPDALVSVCGHRYLFTHGSQFRGGDGMIGPLGPIIRGDHKKRGRNAQVGQDYDTLVIGHFHQLVQMKRVIINGSLIGYNEYAYACNFGYEPPQQALWITHPRHGITFSMPVNVAEDAGKCENKGGVPWVSFHEPKLAA